MQLLKKKGFIRAISMTAITAVTVITMLNTPVFKAGASNYQEQLNALKNKQSETQSKINGLQDDIKEQDALIDALQSKIDVVQAQIDIYNGKIDELNTKISKSQAEKKALNESLQARKETFMKRLRAMYMSGDTSTLALLLSADDFGDFLYKYQLLTSVTEYDGEAIDQIKTDINRVKQLETSLKTDKAEVTELSDAEKEKRSELETTMSEYNTVKASLESKQNKLEGDLSEYNASIDALESAIQQAADEARQTAAAAAAAATADNGDDGDTYAGDNSKSSPVFDGGNFLDPLGSFPYFVSSEYGPRWGSFHKGLDLAGGGIYGAPVYAAASGTVILAGWDGSGYGNYIMVSHGNNSNGDNFTTLYGHCSSLAVSDGQSVSAGQVIGYVGSTGRSTGPHLHFEVRVNGSASNPRNYRSF